MSRQSEWQIRQIAAGNCSRCGKERSSYKRYCDQCAKNIAIEVNKLQHARIAKGMCAKCGKRPIAGKWSCAECKAKFNLYSRAYKAKRGSASE